MGKKERDTIKGIIALQQYCKSIESISDGLDIDKLRKLYSGCVDVFRRQYKLWFGDLKEYSDEHIAHQIFFGERETSQMKTWVQYELCALMRSLERIYTLILSHYQEAGFGQYIYDTVKILQEVLTEAVPFLDYGHYHVTGKSAGYGWGKRNVINSLEVFEASKMLFRESIYNIIGDFAVRPTSVFLIRQAIELRIKNALGIRTITDTNGEIQKVSGEKLLPLLTEKPEMVELPVDPSLLPKIWGWSNYWVHGGFAPYTWEIEWAHHILRSLFSRGSHGNHYSVFGSIKIKRQYYDALEEHIKKLVRPKDPNSVVVERMEHPESIIID